MGIDEAKTTARAAKREEKSRARARARRRNRETEEWLWEAIWESGVWPALLEWVSSLEDAYETLDRSGTDDNCRDQISFELISADGEVKARLTEVLANISIPKLHEMLAELEPLTCKGLKETE